MPSVGSVRKLAGMHHGARLAPESDAPLTVVPKPGNRVLAALPRVESIDGYEQLFLLFKSGRLGDLPHPNSLIICEL